MDRQTLKAETRNITGGKVKALRRSGLLPATVYGKSIPSISVSVPAAEMVRVYSHTGETGLIDLQIDGSVRPVLVHHVQTDPVSHSMLHIEFHQVDLKEKVHADIPLEIVGVSETVEQGLGIMLQVLSEVEVEALPTGLPEKIEVDVSGLTDVGQVLKVADLRIPTGVTVLTDQDLDVVRIAPATKVEEAPVAVEAEGETEGESSAEGETAETEKAEAAPEEK
jgi:large subunit ribosomal protein L25